MENELIKNEDGGRPTKYKRTYARQAYRFCLLGATDKQLSDFMEVSVDTIYEWKKKHREFSEALRRGKSGADAKVAQALFKRAVGFTYDEVTFEKVDAKVNLDITPTALISTDAYKKKVVTKYVIPDTGAITLWLSNRQKELWRKEPGLEKFTEEQLDQIIQKLKISI